MVTVCTPLWSISAVFVVESVMENPLSWSFSALVSSTVKLSGEFPLFWTLTLKGYSFPGETFWKGLSLERITFP